MSGEHAPQRTRSPAELDRNPRTPLPDGSVPDGSVPDGSVPNGSVPNGEAAIRLEPPGGDDGREMWRVARDSRTLDLNSPYSYLLWCRDFADTSVIARDADRVCGFITGFIRPRSAATLFIWQVAVDPSYRGQGLAKRMLDHLGDRVAAEGRCYLEATVTPDNTASSRLFESFARGRGCGLERRTLFSADQFPSGPQSHHPEVLFRIGPF